MYPIRMIDLWYMERVAAQHLIGYPTLHIRICVDGRANNCYMPVTTGIWEIRHDGSEKGMPIAVNIRQGEGCAWNRGCRAGMPKNRPNRRPVAKLANHASWGRKSQLPPFVRSTSCPICHPQAAGRQQQQDTDRRCRPTQVSLCHFLMTSASQTCRN